MFIVELYHLIQLAEDCHLTYMMVSTISIVGRIQPDSEPFLISEEDMHLLQ